MTWTAPGPNPAGFTHNTATLPLTTHTVGNLMLVLATCHNPTSGNEWCTGFTSTTPNVTGWTQVTTTTNNVNTQLAVDSANDVWGGNAWFGTVSAVSTDNNLTPAWSGPDNPPFYVNIVAMEFHSTVGSWYLDTWTFLNDNTGVAAWPALTPAASGELYMGYAWNAVTASSGSTSGYVYNANSDQTGNGMAYNLSCGAGTATAPTWADSTENFGLMVLVAEGAPGSAQVLPYAGGQVYQRRLRQRRQAIFPVPATSITTAVAYGTSQDIIAGGAGSWVNPANADGAPDGTYATWTAP